MENTKLLIDELKAYIDQTTDLMGQAAPHVWELAVRDAVITGWIYVVISTACLVVIAVALRFVLRTVANRSTTSCEEDLMAIVFGSFALIAVLILGVIGVDAVHHLANPEFRALENLMGMVWP